MTRRWSSCLRTKGKRCCKSGPTGCFMRGRRLACDKNSLRANDFVGETNRDRNGVSHLNEYYDEVIACVRDAAGDPGSRSERSESGVSHADGAAKLRGHVAEMKTVASLTDQQIDRPRSPIFSVIVPA